MIRPSPSSHPFAPGPLFRAASVPRAEADQRGRRGFVAGLTIGLALGVFAATIAGAALAQGYQPAPAAGRMRVEAGANGCVAQIVVENRAGVYNATETLDVPGYGPASVTYETVGGHRPGDDDRIAVASLPPGLSADPMEAPIRDGDTLKVCLTEWIGG